MERLTKNVITIKHDIALQEALDKLAGFEDAEDEGRLLVVPYEVYYINNNKINKGQVAQIVCDVSTTDEEGPSCQYRFKIEIKHGCYFNGVLGIDVFLTEEEAFKYIEGYELARLRGMV